MSEIVVGARVRVVSIGETITPPEWVGELATVRAVNVDRGPEGLSVRIQFDGDPAGILVPVAPTELVLDSSGSESRYREGAEE